MKISLRRKIILTFCLFLLVGGTIWFINYLKQQQLGQTLQCLDNVQDLFNTILEARRYEKNYFLTLEHRNLNDALSYVHQGEEALSNIMEGQTGRILVDNLDGTLEKLRNYKDSLEALQGHYENDAVGFPEEFMVDLSTHQEQVRTTGKRITRDLEVMVKNQRQYVSQLMTDASTYHFIAFGAILTLCVFTALYLVFNVNRPLKSIEDATEKITNGDYNDIPVLSTGDEFESLVISLNHMIAELHRRSEQLIQSEKMASLGTLTSGVAHELNNPLNNMSTSVQILLEELEGGDMEYKKQLLRDTETQIERARDIVKALLEFSRDRSFTPKPVHFRDLVSQTLKLIKGEVPANMKIEVDVPDSIEAEMDPRRIQQVLINLILNGAQAMDGRGRLHIVAWEEKEGDNGGFCFQVRDTGQGISPEDLPKIFDPFFTTKGVGHKDVGQGSGLGLPVSQGIIEQHGGWMKAEAEVGKGSTFTVFLPGRRPSRAPSEIQTGWELTEKSY
jgi:signal transduction histidine kinase